MFELTAPPTTAGASSDEWYTPAWLLDAVARARPIDIDPCSDSSRGTPAALHYVGSEGENGLCRPWHGHVWINPPYSSIPPWLTAARVLIDNGAVELATVLIPFRPEGYWSDTVWHPASLIGHFHRRIVFEHPRGNPADGGGRFPSALVVMASDPMVAIEHAEEITRHLPDDRAAALTWLCAAGVEHG